MNLCDTIISVTGYLWFSELGMHGLVSIAMHFDIEFQFRALDLAFLSNGNSVLVYLACQKDMGKQHVI